MKFGFISTVLVVALIGSGCVTSRETTTPRTAVEQALLSEAAERALAKLEADPVLYTRAYIDSSEVVSVDKEYINSAFRRRLAQQGLAIQSEKDNADVLVYPRVGIMGIDEGTFLLGIPAIPIPIPAVGTFETPELALFKRGRQVGRAKIGAYALDAETGSLAFDYDRESASVYNVKHTLLFLIGWRATNLEDPYKKRRDEK